MRCDRCDGKVIFNQDSYQCFTCGKETYIPKKRTGAKLEAFKGNIQLIRQEGKEPLVVFSHVTEKGSTLQLRPRCPYCNQYMIKTSHGYHKERHLSTIFKCVQDHQVVLKYGADKKIVGWW